MRMWPQIARTWILLALAVALSVVHPSDGISIASGINAMVKMGMRGGGNLLSTPNHYALMDEEEDSLTKPTGKSTTTVVFRVLANSTAPGDTVVVIGGGDHLAGWDKDNALKLTTSKNEFPWWSTEIVMPAGEKCEFKFAIRRANGRFDWEAGENRIYEVPPKPGKCHVAASSMFGMRMMIDSGIPLPGAACASTTVERRESKMEVRVEHPESEEEHASHETGSRKASPSKSAKAFVPTAAPVSRGNSANSAFIATTKPSKSASANSAFIATTKPDKSSSAAAAIVTTATGTSSQVAIRRQAPAKKGVIKAITKPVPGAAISAKSPYGFVKKAIQAVVGLFSDDTTVDFELMLLNTVQSLQEEVKVERERADEALCTVSEKEVLLKSLAEAKERSDRQLSQKCSEVTSQLAVAREDIVSKVKLLNKKEAELAQVRDLMAFEKSNAAQAIAGLRGERDAARAEVMKSNGEIGELKQELAATCGERDKVTSSLAEVTKTKDELSASLATVTQERDSLNGEVGGLRKDIKELTGDYEESKVQLVSARTENSKSKDSARKQLLEMENEMREKDEVAKEECKKLTCDLETMTKERDVAAEDSRKNVLLCLELQEQVEEMRRQHVNAKESASRGGSIEEVMRLQEETRQQQARLREMRWERERIVDEQRDTISELYNELAASNDALRNTLVTTRPVAEVDDGAAVSETRANRGRVHEAINQFVGTAVSHILPKSEARGRSEEAQGGKGVAERGDSPSEEESMEQSASITTSQLTPEAEMVDRGLAEDVDVKLGVKEANAKKNKAANAKKGKKEKGMDAKKGRQEEKMQNFQKLPPRVVTKSGRAHFNLPNTKQPSLSPPLSPERVAKHASGGVSQNSALSMKTDMGSSGSDRMASTPSETEESSLDKEELSERAMQAGSKPAPKSDAASGKQKSPLAKSSGEPHMIFL